MQLVMRSDGLRAWGAALVLAAAVALLTACVRAPAVVPQARLRDVVGALRSGGRLVDLGRADAEKIIYVFADPNCIFCYRLDRALQPYLGGGRLRERVVLVGFVRRNSLVRAAAILGSVDPAGAWRTNEENFQTASEQGGYPIPSASPPPWSVAAVRDNMQWMARAGFTATPGILYRDTAGKWVAVQGFPGVKGVRKLIADINVQVQARQRTQDSVRAAKKNGTG